MKRILFVIDSLNSGGAEKSLLSLLNLFDYEKYEVHLLMFSPTGLFLPLLSKKVKIIDIPDFFKEQQKGIRYLIKTKQFKRLYLRLRTSISLRNPFIFKKMHSAQMRWKWISTGVENLSLRYDVAIAYSQGVPTYFVAEKVNADKKICWINTDYKVALYNKKFDTDYYNQFNNIVAVSDQNKEVFVSEMPSLKDKTLVIYDIVSPTLIRSMAVEQGGFEDDFDGLRILTIGRLVDVKGYDMAIKACQKLKNEGHNFKWYAIGEGSQRTVYEKMVKELNLEDTFIFLGTFNNPYTFLKQCDIYVQPSRFEGYGLAVAEARILQKPVVATNFTIVQEQIINNKNGIIVDMNSVSLYKGIKNLIENWKLSECISMNLGKEKVGTEDEIFKVYRLIN